MFNNAGITFGGPTETLSLDQWNAIVDVNIRGVIHGVAAAYPVMIAQESGHIVNTASMGGLLPAGLITSYAMSKHAVVALSETLYQDLSLVSDQVRAHVLCPFFVATGIHDSGRNRPQELANPDAKPTRSQMIAQAMTQKAVTSGKVTAAMVAQYVLDAVRDDRFYIYSHPKALSSVQTRMEDVLQQRNPSDPLKDAPEMGKQLRDALRAK